MVGHIFDKERDALLQAEQNGTKEYRDTLPAEDQKSVLSIDKTRQLHL